MEGHLIPQAQQEGIENFKVGAIIHKGDNVLLLERKISDEHPGLFEVPNTEIEEEEAFNQALRRLVMLQTGLEIAEIEKFLSYVDFTEKNKKVRQFNFIVTVNDSYEVNSTTHQGFAWVKPKDGVGYPIDEKNMTILDQI